MNDPASPTTTAPTTPALDTPQDTSGRIGVLLVNLGTPDAADAAGVRRYLKEFLSDPRVIENQGLLWKLGLNGVVLTARPGRQGRDYREIWDKARAGSP